MADAKWDYKSPDDMLAMVRDALERWSIAPAGRAAERQAARDLAFSVRRLDTMGVLAAGVGKVEAER